jgi:MSHA biogenesis protein MshL
MKSNKLAYLGIAISSVLMLGGCTSIAQREATHESVKTDIVKAVNESINTEDESQIKLKEQVLAEKAPVMAELKKEARFNLLVNKAPIGAILESLVDGTSYSLITPEELTGNISLNLKNATAFDVLETLKNAYHYDYEVQDKRITVYPNGIRTKYFVINHLVGKRKGNSELKVNSGSLSDAQINNSNNGSNNNGNNTNNTNNNNGNNFGNNQTQAVSTKISTSTESDFWKEIEQVVSTMIGVKEGRSVIVSPETNTLVIKALPKEINEAEKYLRKIQAVIDKQVVIEAKIIEVELNNSMQAGVNWAAFKNGSNNRASIGFGNSGASLSPTGTISTVGNNVSANPGQNLTIGALDNVNAMFSLAFQTSNFASILNFLETQGSLQVLSSPRIATLNNQKALLKVGTDEFFVTNVTTTSTATSAGTTNTPSITTQPFFSGIALDITPQIDENGLVTMHVHPSVSKVSTVTKNINLGSLGSITLPLASSTISETDSVVKIEHNKIVAIGGLMKQYSRKERNQIPGIGDAPILGNAFKNQDDDTAKYELVILIKPQIITTQADWETSLAEVRKRLADFDPPNTTIVVNGDDKKSKK